MTDFTKTKPTLVGAYQLRGWARLDGEPRKQCIVTVEALPDDTLVCNLHRETSDHKLNEWYRVSELDPEFEWRGPQHFIMADEREALDEILREYEKLFDTEDDQHFMALTQLATRLKEGGP